MPSIRVLPDQIQREQQHRVGLTEKDRWGRKWSYAELTPGTYQQGLVLEDEPIGDFIAGGTGASTANIPAGGKVLQDTGEFAGSDLRGAVGVIQAGAGQGQIFIVTSVEDANTLNIVVPNSDGQGWEAAITVSSTYRLRIPGRVQIATSQLSLIHI